LGVGTQFSGSTRWHPRLLEAAAAMHDDRLDVAERILKPHLQEDPFDVRAIRMLAELAARIGRLKDAEKLLRRALEIAPEFTPARANLAMILGRLGRAGERSNCSMACFRPNLKRSGISISKPRRWAAWANSKRRSSSMRKCWSGRRTSRGC
jgi:predicted Zn-dependent protease